MHLVLLLLASCLASARGLSHRVAHTFAVSHCGNSSARRFGVFARAFFPARTTLTRTASHLTAGRSVCTRVTPPRHSKKHEFWPLNGSFLSGLRRVAKPALLWKPCGNCFSQKRAAPIWKIKKSAHYSIFLSSMLNINDLLSCRVSS